MHNYYRQPIMAFWAFALLAISMLWGASAYAVTPAGTVIKNLATVTYEDTLGNSYTAQSNESTVTVAEVYNTVLSPLAQSKDGTFGQTVYFPHQLTNNGNTEESFNLTAKLGGTTELDRALTELTIYRDINGNGQPDDGDPIVGGTGEATVAVLVAAGSVESIVVSAKVPDSVTGSVTQLQLTLTAISTATESGKTPKQEAVDTVNITSDRPVLVTSKELISHTPATLDTKGRVKYRIEVINNGTDLSKGEIYSFLPDFMDAEKKAVAAGEEGVHVYTTDIRVKAPEFDTENSFKEELTPANVPSTDYITGNDAGIKFPIEKLKKGDSIAIEYSVTYSAKSGTEPNEIFNFDAEQVLKNKAFVGYNVTSNGAVGDSKWNTVVQTNIVETKLPQFFGLTLVDDVTVESAPAGGVVSFEHTITNLSNGPDAFNLTAVNNAVNSFPAETKFSFWDESGNTLLSDTDGDTIPDTGSVAGKNSTVKIIVKAHLPPEISGTGTYQVVVTATSSKDPSRPAANASVTDTLGAITTTGNGVDLAHYKTNANDSNIIIPEIEDLSPEELFDPETNAHEQSFVTTTSLKPGKTLKYGLAIANESVNSNSYGIESEIEAIAASTKTGFDWKVTYIHDGVYSESGETIQVATGQVITSTPKLAGRTFMKVIALVEVPTGAAIGDYSISFTTTSHSHADLTDTTTNKIIIEKNHVLEFGPDGANQIEAGGIAFYTHQLRNVGNTDLSVVISGSDADSLNGWNYLIYQDDVQIGSPGVPTTPIVLEAGSEEAQTIRVKVMAPANAPAGDVFSLILTANAGSGAESNVLSVNLTNTTTIIKGQIVLTKDVARKTSPRTSVGPAFQPHLPSVKPGETVIWRVTAVVQGSAPAENVIISDAAPLFTKLAQAETGGIPGNPIIKQGDQVITPITDLVDVDETSGNITFYVGDGAAKPTGGTLNPGESVEVTFEVMLDPLPEAESTETPEPPLTRR